MTPFQEAFDRAARRLDWSRPCLVWLADYIAGVTGKDPAGGWRHIEWTERRARASLARLARHGEGETPVERALDVIAKRDGWTETDGPRQGAIMVGVYRDEDIGFPAIFDGERGWLVGYFGAATVLLNAPARMWEIAA